MNQKGGGFLAWAESNYHRDVIWVQLFDCCPVSGDPEAEAGPLVTPHSAPAEDGETQTRV